MTTRSITKEPALRQARRILDDGRLRRLAACLLAAVVFALMTGPSGSLTDPVAGFKGALFDSRLWIFLGLGLLLWLILVVHEKVAPAARRLTDVVMSAPVVRDRRARYSFYVALLAFAILLPNLITNAWKEITVDEIGVYVLLAIGLNVVVGFAGLLDLGYIAFYAVGAYSCAYWTGSLGIQPPHIFNPFVSIILAVVAAMLAGVVLGMPTLRLRGDYLAIVTLGFGEIVKIYAVNLGSVTGGSQGPPNPVPHFSINAVGVRYQWKIDNTPYYYLLLGFVVVILVVFHLLENSRVGRAWTAIREDEVAAQASGINTYKYKLLAFAIGASTSGFAGVLFASKIQTFTPNSFDVTLSILVLVLVIFGGMGSLAGAVVGAAVIQWAPNALRTYIKKEDLFVYLGAILVVMMIYRPQGMVPSRRRSRELAMAEEGLTSADAVETPAAEQVQ